MDTNTLNHGIKDFTLTVLNPCPYDTVIITSSILSSWPNFEYKIYNEAFVEILDWGKIIYSYSYALEDEVVCPEFLLTVSMVDQSEVDKDIIEIS